ncbi:MAG TPA: hypothetical protein VGE13_01610 [Candidatus Saccharimonadales bacterium]
MTHIIYLPGFGDYYDILRRFALRKWQSKNTQVTFVAMNWADKRETYEQKYQRVAKAIQDAAGDKIVIVGESAGGAMALFAFSRHIEQIDQVITICGYNHGASDVHPIHKIRRPAFYRLMPQVDRAVENFDTRVLRQITTIYSTRDHVVTPSHTQIKGSKEVRLSTRGHLVAIAQTLIRKIPLELLK